MFLVKYLRLTSKHLHAFAMCGLTEDLRGHPDQRRIHFIAVCALQDAAKTLEEAADKIESGAPASRPRTPPPGATG